MVEKCCSLALVPIRWHDPTPTSVIWCSQEEQGHSEGCFPGAEPPALKINISAFSWHLVLKVTWMRFGICLVMGDNCTRVGWSQRALLEFLLGSVAASWSSQWSTILWNIRQHNRCKQSAFTEELSWNNIFFLKFVLSINLSYRIFKEEKEQPTTK